MPRINTVAKCRKDQGRCSRCGVELPVGSAYIYWEFRYGGTHKRCTAQACYPRPSELTGSEKMCWALEAQELLEDFANRSDSDYDGYTEDEAVAAWEEIREFAAEAKDEAHDKAQEASEGYQESADAMAEYFDGSDKHQELESLAQELECWADQIESIDTDVELEFIEGGMESPGEVFEAALQELKGQFEDAAQSIPDFPF